ncbi:hypothetical protein BH10BAC3_BH10BAC3_08680 [soil metagenome]
MDTRQQSLDTLKEIRTMMERSSRFISLSGWSGVAAGICALVGAWFGNSVIDRSKVDHDSLRKHYGADDSLVGQPINIRDYMGSQLLQIAVITLTAAILLAFFFTYLKSKKSGTPLWGIAARRLSVSMLVPMAIGGLYLLKLMQAGAFGLIAPGCLLFYGLALVNASKYTLGEIKWLGYAQLITGTICLFYPGYGIYFWAFGFGVLHIVYGMVMWFRYERN